MAKGRFTGGKKWPAPEERLWQQVEKSDGCWLWRGIVNNKGYGYLSAKNKLTLVHRLSFALANGPIPKGAEVCHSCDTPRCVRPDHLWLGTHAENLADAGRQGRMFSRCAGVTHCPRGHPYDAENTMPGFNKNGKPRRACRECSRVRFRAWYAKHPGCRARRSA